MRQHAKYNSYWKLETFDEFEMKRKLRNTLLKAGRLGPGLESKVAIKELSYLMVRQQLQQVQYITCSMDELEKFMADRNITQLPTYRKDSKATTLIKSLQAADKATSFRRFQDLPPELRNEVYKYYVADFPEHLWMPAQPPLAHTGRLVRSEVLPVFYQNCSLQIKLRRTGGSSKGLLRFDIHAYALLSSLSPENLAEMRKFRLDIIDDRDDTKQIRCSVTIGDSHAKVAVAGVERISSFTQASQRTISMTAAQKCLLKVFDGVAKREEKKKLRIGDLYAARKALEKVLYGGR